MVLKLPNNELPFEKRFENIRNCRVLKLEKIFRVLHRGFGRREITWCSNRISSMCRWISSLEGWITWYSNAQKYTGNNEFGLEEDKITWYSNTSCLHVTARKVLEESKITGFSNLLRRRKRRPRDWEGNRIARCSNDAAIWSKQSNVLEAKELQGTQTTSFSIDLRR